MFGEKRGAITSAPNARFGRRVCRRSIGGWDTGAEGRRAGLLHYAVSNQDAGGDGR